MNRRGLLKQIAAPLAAFLVGYVARPLYAATEVGAATARTSALAEYEKLRFGVSFHFSTPTFTGDDYDTGAQPASVYNPTHLDVRQWIRVAHDFGAKYAILTAKYMSGFCLWDSHNGSIISHDPTAGTFRTIGAPWRFRRTPVEFKRLPLKGEHTAEILKELGYTSDEISEFEHRQVV
jgi:hypothetical protein